MIAVHYDPATSAVDVSIDIYISPRRKEVMSNTRILDINLVLAAINFVLWLATGCGDNIVEEPSVDAGLPACADIGCPDAAFCTADGICTCLATGEPMSCRQ